MTILLVYLSVAFGSIDAASEATTEDVERATQNEQASEKGIRRELQDVGS
ncbi:MAG: hypothetical protein AAFY41_09380 [Bacteroidota bacterium]